jgi:DNA-binding NarL/FixJ family response regulator
MAMTPETKRRLRTIARRIEQAMTDRDAAIVEARAAGATQREIGAALGLSHVAVGNILKAQEPSDSQ